MNIHYILVIILILIIFLYFGNKIIIETLETIPKNLFMLWEKKLPPVMYEYYLNLKKENPDFNIEIKDENDCRKFIQENFDKKVLDAYNCLIPVAYKSDLARLCYLYKLGGIYLDTKFVPVNGTKLSHLITKDHFVRDVDYSGSGIYNGFMVSHPNNPLLLKIINEIVANVNNKYYGKSALEPTGPLLHNKMIKDSDLINLRLQSNNHKVSIIDTDGKIIFMEYPEYRSEQKKHGHGKRYAVLWEERMIYNC